MDNMHRDRVVAVFTSFQPTRSLVEHCAAVAPQVRQVIVVDDGSGAAFEPVLVELEGVGAVVLRQATNSGIAAAMNRGFVEAQRAAAEFVVTFDQDSEVPEGFVDALVQEYDRAAHQGVRVAMVAPEYYSLTRQTDGREHGGVLFSYAPIQSGLLMPVSVIDELGPQREDFFIDLVETEYYFRAHSKGYEAICVPGLTLPHGFGHRLHVYLFGKRLVKRDGRPRTVAVSSPFRYYYRARNRRVLNREYRHDRSMRTLLRRDGRRDLLLDYAVAVWSARGKVKLMSLIVAGWRDAHNRQLGKMPNRLASRARTISWRHPAD